MRYVNHLKDSCKYTCNYTLPVLILAALLSMHSYAFAELPKVFIARDGVKMKLIPKGSFIMGSSEEDLKATAALHKVKLKAFYMDEHLVTNRNYVKFLNETGIGNEKGSDRFHWVVTRDDLQSNERKDWWITEIGHERGKFIAFEGFEDYPVITVSWLGAMKYCQWAGKRLPTEAEWEKSARGGLKSARFSWGNSLPTEPGIVFNRYWETNEDPPPLEHVKYGMPNGYGLYNISGMIWEWCSDWFDPDYYVNSPRDNPMGPEAGQMKVLRGGAWFNAANVLRVALRNFIIPEALDETTGFRCASDVPAGIK